MADICPSCNENLQTNFRFCPFCGHDLEKPIICQSCQYINEANSRYCQDCGTPLQFIIKNNNSKKKGEDDETETPPLEPPPIAGITIEFPFSTAQSFDFAVEAARLLSNFKQFGQLKKAIYRVTLHSDEIESAENLLEHLKGWRKKTVYVDGEKVTWDSVFSFNWCYERKKASFKPSAYCFGFENEYQLNVWGCIHTNLPFVDNAQWFCWGSWLNNKGDWKFDKDRIRYALQKELYQYRYCPALKPELIEDVLITLPDVVNPLKDKNWKFVERWGDDTTPGLVMVVTHYGIKENVVMIGVAPNSQGALKELVRRMKYSVPNME